MMGFREIADTWASFYAGSAAMRSTMMFAHLGALIVGGGSAIAADLGTTRALRQDPVTLQSELERLHRAHRLVIASIGVVVLSGVSLTLADFDAYVGSTSFWVKMSLFAALLVNGSLLIRTTSERRSRLRILTLASLVLWLATTLLGTVVPNVL